ncbi:hypothetical protein DJ524_06195 [Sulfolobus sp. D5]|nr:hypothetical protein DJ528_06605 [Sulfolobus sp. B5]TRM80844.1 hypothetical protein DJ524_06195 [Sulfolobus sp. D5]TRM84249.1 hypothetical protein DJ522_05165 [Sulfolobus sp. F3]
MNLSRETEVDHIGIRLITEQQEVCKYREYDMLQNKTLPERESITTNEEINDTQAMIITKFKLLSILFISHLFILNT